MIVKDFEEAFQVLGTKNVKGNILHKNGLKYKLRPHFEDIKINLQLQGLPAKITVFRNNKLYPVPLVGKSGGTVAASKTEVWINNQLVIFDKIGASKKARVDPNLSPLNTRYFNKDKKGNNLTNYNARDVNHAEQDNLGQVVDQIDGYYSSNIASNISKYRSMVKGQVYIYVDRVVCSNCTAGALSSHKTVGSLVQFSTEFPNIKLIIVDPSKTSQPLTLLNGVYK